MTVHITVDTENIRFLSERLTAHAAGVQYEFDQLRMRLQFLDEAWQGEAQRAFRISLAHTMAEAEARITALKELARAANTAAQAYAETEKKLEALCSE